MDDQFVNPRDHWKYSRYISQKYGFKETLNYNLQVFNEKRELFLENLVALAVICTLPIYEFGEKLSTFRHKKSKLES